VENLPLNVTTFNEISGCERNVVSWLLKDLKRFGAEVGGAIVLAFCIAEGRHLMSLKKPESHRTQAEMGLR
jgi:hypothetical protein